MCLVAEAGSTFLWRSGEAKIQEDFFNSSRRSKDNFLSMNDIKLNYLS